MVDIKLLLEKASDENEHEFDNITVSTIWYFNIQNRLRKAEEIVDMLIKSRDEYKSLVDEAIEMVEKRDKQIKLLKRKNILDLVLATNEN